MRGIIFHTPTRRWRSFVLMTAIALGAACSQEPDRPPRTIDTPYDAGTDADTDLDVEQPDGGDTGDSDVNDPDAPDAEDPDADADVEAPDASDAEDSETSDAEESDGGDTDPAPVCLDSVIELGELSAGQHTVTIDALDAASGTESGCAGNEDVEQVALRFQVADEGQVVFGGDELALSWVNEPCSAAAPFCVQESVRSFVIPDRDYILFVSPLPEPQSLVLEFSTFEECEVSGEVRCLGPDNVEACTTSQSSPDVPRWYSAPCDSGCSDDACGGNSCANPVLVDGDVEFNFASSAFTNTFDVGANGPCDFGSASLGREVIFEVADMQQGESFRVEVDDPSRQHRIFVLNACDETATCLGSESGASSLEFTAPESGTYFVIVDAEADIPGGMRVTIE